MDTVTRDAETILVNKAGREENFMWNHLSGGPSLSQANARKNSRYTWWKLCAVGLAVGLTYKYVSPLLAIVLVLLRAQWDLRETVDIYNKWRVAIVEDTAKLHRLIYEQGLLIKSLQANASKQSAYRPPTIQYTDSFDHEEAS
jgi:hypothetical protein